MTVCRRLPARNRVALATLAPLLFAGGCGGAVEQHEVDVLVYGRGRVILDPGGGAYPEGTVVALLAVDNGASFSFWGRDASGSDPIARVVVNRDLTVTALFETAPKPSQSFDDRVIIAGDGAFLGVINNNRFDVNSIANPLGDFGSVNSDTCIWNPLSTYGADFGNLSAYAGNAQVPPIIVGDDGFFAFLTRNPQRSPGLDPNDVAVTVGRDDQVRD